MSGVWCPRIPPVSAVSPHGVRFVERVGAADSVRASTVGVPVSGLWLSGVRVLCPRISCPPCPPCPRRVGSWSVGEALLRRALETAGFGVVARRVRKRPGCLPELAVVELAAVVLDGESAAELAAV